MKTTRLKTASRRLLADTLTPVNIYLKLRDVFAGSLLLESSDYHGQENSTSLICCEPMAYIKVQGGTVTRKYPDGTTSAQPASRQEVVKLLDEFRQSFAFADEFSSGPAAGLYGYMNYDAVRYFEDIDMNAASAEVPDLYYQLFRYVIAINHFTNELVLFESRADGAEPDGLDQLIQVIRSGKFPSFPFRLVGERSSTITDREYIDRVERGIGHARAGDVFQIVLSRRFHQAFRGDEFNVYRALRSINPSPYLFYFDFISFRIFGSSPEAQLKVKNGVATIFPIAGTFRRTGNDKEDALLAEKLVADEKENAEHLMLVDLARNDLSRSAGKVKVDVLREIQYYSHVIHLVSKVSGTLPPGASSVQLMADTFPAGTLSGAPKHRAMSLIREIEGEPRGFYGGALGFIGCNGDINHAIMIRTFMSRHNDLVSQAGAGVVARSSPPSELAEVNNKLEALRKALLMAENL